MAATVQKYLDDATKLCSRELSTMMALGASAQPTPAATASGSGVDSGSRSVATNPKVNGQFILAIQCIIFFCVWHPPRWISTLTTWAFWPRSQEAWLLCARGLLNACAQHNLQSWCLHLLICHSLLLLRNSGHHLRSVSGQCAVNRCSICERRRFLTACSNTTL